LLKQLTKGLLERMLNAELTKHLGYEKHDPACYGSGKKRVNADVGEFELTVPRDREATFEPQIVPKGQTRFPGFDDKILSLYARGMRTRDIQPHLRIHNIRIQPHINGTARNQPPKHYGRSSGQISLRCETTEFIMTASPQAPTQNLLTRKAARLTSV
jgi:hypothetical protein